jgi:hypothetical protein
MKESHMSHDAFANPPGAAPANLLQVLAQANGFTMEDLQANREGLMSPRQRTALVRRTGSCLFWILFVTVCVMVGPAIALGVVVGSVWALVVVIAGLAVFALLSTLFIGSTRQQLRAGRVAFVDGFVERQRKESSDSDGGTSVTYTYIVYQPQADGIKQQSFTVDGAAYHALVPGLRYRIYYLDYKLVSIEPLA